MKKNLLYILMLACVAIFTACSENDLVDQDYDSAYDKVHFYGAVKKQSSIQVTSRATPDPDLYITLNETTEDFGIFYIWQNVVDNNETEQIFQQYVETNGTQGNLEINGSGTPLNWHNKTSEHTFYAWTQPCVEGKGGVQISADKFPTFGTQTGNIEEIGTVKYGTNEDTELEKFIVAQKGPISYNEWGQDVALYFERPIAKITLKGVTYITASGDEHPNIETCTILFPNMFNTAVFKPLNWTNGVQNVLQTVDKADNKGITWEWYIEKEYTDESNKHDAHSLYVHPFKFGNENEEVSAGNNVNIHDDPGFFIVKLEVENQVKSYTGTLNSLSTIRELKAGEHMQLYLTVTDGGGVGVGYEIVDWTDKPSQTLPQYRIPGVYNKEDAERLLEALQKAADNTSGYIFPEGVEDLVVNKGDETNPQYEINLFTHIDWSSVTNGDIKIPDGYTLKGNGYNITLKEGVNITGKQVENIYVNNRVPGVYSEAEADKLLKALTATEESSEKFPNDVKDLLVGSTINLFCNIDWSNEQISGQITIPDGYSLNGNGYNITLPNGVSITGNDNIKNLYVNGGLYPNENGESGTNEPSGSDAIGDPTT